MLVDNSRFSDLNDIFDSDLYHSSSFFSPPSNASSPLLTTPPQDIQPYFPEIHDEESFNALFEEELKGIDPFALMQPSVFMPIDPAYGGPTAATTANDNMGVGMGNAYGMLDISTMPMSIVDPTDVDLPHHQSLAHGINLGIDPQLVDTPSAISDHGDGDNESEDSHESASPPSTSASSSDNPAPSKDTAKEREKEKEKPTITIAPVKVGGHGKSRKGTVQSGGVTKRAAGASLTAAHHKEKENAGIGIVKKAPTSSTKHSKSPSFLDALMSPSPFVVPTPSGPSSALGLPRIPEESTAASEAGDREDEDDLPQDWRPSPEVFAKMTSKEKRQLRNKISARNFRIRRKEYISTLEGDIAERDRLLDHFRTQLGTRDSENLALRQEIAALKKALLEGRGGTVNLPPPGPLPPIGDLPVSVVDGGLPSTVATSNTSTGALLTPNTQKDLPTSPRLGLAGFWGGVAGGVGGGGITPVHTTLVPDITTILRRGLMENINPALNSSGVGQGQSSTPSQAAPNPGFEGFADLNPFTMKTLDAYRMHLWGKMASQHQHHQHSYQQHSPSSSPSSSPLHSYSHSSTSSPSSSPSISSSNLAASLRPHFFSSSSKPNIPYSHSSSSSSALTALLSGKHAASSFSSAGYSHPPASSMLHAKGFANKENQQREREPQAQQAQAMLAAMASQTILKKLGNAFWDAFTGVSTSSASISGSPISGSGVGFGSSWDSDKVKRVLEGKAVLRVVDVDGPFASSPSSPASVPTSTLETDKSVQMTTVRSGVAGMVSASASGTSVGGATGTTKCALVVDLLEESMRSLTLGKKM